MCTGRNAIDMDLQRMSLIRFWDCAQYAVVIVGKVDGDPLDYPQFTLRVLIIEIIISRKIGNRKIIDICGCCCGDKEASRKKERQKQNTQLFLDD
jgi:hypothetical protein